ncbi:MAG: hypothetical protein KAG26_09260, partial [Methylococcales bacterium]|nr:hypothetical protein [Methylococcales bacterium]
DSDKDRELIKKEFMSYIKEKYWDGSKDGDFLDLMMIIEGAFSTLKKEQVEIFNIIHLDMYKRLLYMATLNTVMAFTTGYLEYKFLTEIFHISFCFDLFVEEKPMPDNYLDLLDQARYSPKESLEKLNHEDISKIELFFKGQNEELVNTIFDFKIDAVKKLFKICRERIKTGGFPMNLNEDVLNDLEKIIIMNQEALTYRNLVIEKNDGVSILKNILISNLKNDDAVDVSCRIVGIITGHFEGEAA